MLHFMPGAAALVRGLAELDGRAIETGADRLRAALDGVHPGAGRWRSWSAGRPIRDIVLDQEYAEPEGTMSFLAAALMCGRAADHRLTGRFAYTEASYAGHILGGAARRRDGSLDAVCREVLGTTPGRDSGRYTMPVHEYLRMAAGLGRRWKLVNQNVAAGLVRVDADDLARLLRDAITGYIRTRIDGMRGRRPPQNVAVPPDIMRWCSRDAARPAGGDTPPCVKRCRDRMDRGENLPHAGRFLVATYFMHGGLDDHTIGEMFAGAPDYDPKITSYHVSQIRRRGYFVPGCRWAASNGLCPGCDASHPTKYAAPAGGSVN